MKPVIELVTTGNELLSGKTVNRHAFVLAERLIPTGIRLLRDTTVPDDVAAIRQAVESALSRVDVVIVTGGLGPTSDDVTRDALAAMLGRGIHIDEPTRLAICERIQKRGRPLTQSVQNHALVVDGCAVLANREGLAPGERFDLPGQAVFLLPGPPREFTAILEDHVLPWLAGHAAPAERPLSAIFEVCGIGESDIVTRLEPMGFPARGVDVAYCAAPGRVEIRLGAAPQDRAGFDATVAMLREGLGEHVFADERLDMEDVVGRLLRERKVKLATAESCTGGLVGQKITNVSGSSDYYLGGVISYANEVKVSALGVDPAVLKVAGAVSEEVATQMAAGVREKFGTDYGLSITGIAGPHSDNTQKPVGLVWMAVAGPRGVVTRRHQFGGSRATVREWAAQLSLDLLRRVLLDRP